MRGPVLIDTNLLILLIVGLVDPELIRVHKNCSSFSPADHPLFLRTVGPDPRFVLLPNVATEASNLLRQIADPHRTRLARLLRAFIEEYTETYVASRTAARHPGYDRLGLTDGAALSTLDVELHLLTVDLDLYLAFLREGRPATNFRHVIDNAA